MNLRGNCSPIYLISCRMRRSFLFKSGRSCLGCLGRRLALMVSIIHHTCHLTSSSLCCAIVSCTLYASFQSQIPAENLSWNCYITSFMGFLVQSMLFYVLLIAPGHRIHTEKSRAPSYFSSFFQCQLEDAQKNMEAGEEAPGVRTLYIDRDPVTFQDISRHLQGYHIQPRDGSHFVKLFADAQFYQCKSPLIWNQTNTNWAKCHGWSTNFMKSPYTYPSVTESSRFPRTYSQIQATHQTILLWDSPSFSHPHRKSSLA